jgi:hypothetical protein
MTVLRSGLFEGKCAVSLFVVQADEEILHQNMPFTRHSNIDETVVLRPFVYECTHFRAQE